MKSNSTASYEYAAGSANGFCWQTVYELTLTWVCSVFKPLKMNLSRRKYTTCLLNSENFWGNLGNEV